MSIPSYTQGYPPDGSSLGQTKSTIRNNLDGTFLTLAVDHIDNNGDPGTNPAGYHKVVHMVPQAGNPAPISGYGQLFTKTVNSFTSDEALFWETGNGIVQQLTTNINPSATTNGRSFLPGGIIMQWGAVNSPGSSGTVAFNATFPSSCFNIQLTARNDGPHSAFNYWVDGIPSTGSFNYQGSTSGSQVLYWVAIGN